jgi:beta-carotene 15,15'-dioxygenase
MTQHARQRAISYQGLAYCAIAMLLAPIEITLGRGGSTQELVIMALIIGLLGVPHGALDIVFAWQQYRLSSLRHWAIFGVLYLAPIAMIALAWQFAPAVFLLAFLIISAVHFSGDPPQGTWLVTRVLYGGTIIVVPVLFHASEVTELFALLAGEPAATGLVSMLHLIAPFWLGLTSLAAIHAGRRDVLTGAEIGATLMLATFAPPLIAFTVFFCFMHSARHILRVFVLFDDVSPRTLLSCGAAAMTGTALIALAAWSVLGNEPLDMRITKLVFIGLAALTLPHMVIVERFRRNGWTKSVQ